MRVVKYLRFCLCFLALLLPATGWAQDGSKPTITPNIPPFLAQEPAPSGPFPDAPQGIWSAPDCTNAQSVLVLSRYYKLHVEHGKHTLSAIARWRDETYDDERLFFYLTHDGGGYLFKMTNDGLIHHLMSFVHPQQPLHTAWDSTIERMSDEHTRCAKLFTETLVVTQDEVNLPFVLDRVKEPCTGIDPDRFAKASACHAALFAAVDHDNNEKLDTAELVRLYKQAVFLEIGMAAGCRVTAQTPVEDDSGAAFAPRFAGDLLRLGDTDGDAALDMGEIRRVIANPLSYRLHETLLQKLRSVRFALGFLPLSDAEKTCTANAPGGKAPVYTGVIILETPAPGQGLGPPGSSGCGCGG